MQICQMSESQTAGLRRSPIKKEPDIMRLRRNEVNFDIICEGHQNYSKAYFMNILRCFDDHEIRPQKLFMRKILSLTSMLKCYPRVFLTLRQISVDVITCH